MQETLFKCNICDESYNTKEKQPRMLPKCGHSICLECLNKFLAQYDDVECLLDGVIMETINKSINDFPINIVLLQFIEKYKYLETSSVEMNNIHQVIQNEPPIKQSMKKSQTQKQLFEHSGKKKKNLLLDALSLEENKHLCPIHKKELEILCKNCPQLICYQCGLFGEHKGHQVVKIDEFHKESEDFCENIQKIANEIEGKEYYMKDQFVEVFYAKKSRQKLDKMKELVEQKFKILQRTLYEEKNQIMKSIEQKMIEGGEYLNEIIEDQMEQMNEDSDHIRRFIQEIVQNVYQNVNKDEIYMKVLRKNDYELVQQSHQLSHLFKTFQKEQERVVDLFFSEFDFHLDSKPKIQGLNLNLPQLNILATEKNKLINDSLMTLGKANEQKQNFLFQEQNIPQEKNLKFFKQEFKSSEKIHKNKIDFRNLRNHKKIKTKIETIRGKLDRCQTSYRRENVKTPKKQLSKGVINEITRLKKIEECSESNLDSNFNPQRILSKNIAIKQNIQQARRIQTAHNFQVKKKQELSSILQSKKNAQFLDLEEENVNETNLQILLDFLNKTKSVRVLLLSNNLLNDEYNRYIRQYYYKTRNWIFNGTCLQK